MNLYSWVIISEILAVYNNIRNVKFPFLLFFFYDFRLTKKLLNIYESSYYKNDIIKIISSWRDNSKVKS